MPTRESSSSVSINASRILPTAGTQPKAQWHGVYIASCAQNNDPLGEGRIKMHVPQVLGNAVSNWARPLGYKPSVVPAVGQMVHAYFAGGDVNHPIWVRTDFTSEFNNIQNQINNLGPGAWSPLQLVNAWSNSSGYQPAQARIVFPGVVQITGTVQGGLAGDTAEIAQVPPGYYNTSSSLVMPVTVMAGASADTGSGSLSGSTDSSGLTDGTINGLSGQDGLTDGTINGTSGTGPNTNNHTHGPGSFSVTNGQHKHDSGSFAVANGNHTHSLFSASVTTSANNNTPMLVLNTSGNLQMYNVSVNATQLSFSAILAV